MPRLALLIPLLLLSACHPETTAPAPALLTVQGHAEVRMAPDRVRFRVAVVTEGESAAAVLAANAERSERVLAALRASGVTTDGLQTAGVQLQPLWSQRPRTTEPDWRPRIVGFQARNQLTIVTAALDGVGALLTAAVDAGATDFDGLQFSLADDSTGREKAIRQATARAMAEAGVLATAAGVELHRVAELRLDGADSRLPPMLRTQAMFDMRAEAALPIEPGEVVIQAQVTLSYLLR